MATKQSKAKVNKESKPKRSNSLKGKPRVMTSAILENPGGRPSVFDEASPKIIASIRAGNTYECACGCARVTYNTFNNWIRQGKEDAELGLEDSKFFKFFCDVTQAESEMENDCVIAWKSFIPSNWQAAKDFLSRRRYESWGNRDKVEMNQNVEISQKAILEIPDNGRRRVD